jgi:hypothetical protein
MANPDYLFVLSQVVSCIRKSLHDQRLPDLTPEQVVHWMHSMTIEHVMAVWEENGMAASSSSVN